MNTAPRSSVEPDIIHVHHQSSEWFPSKPHADSTDPVVAGVRALKPKLLAKHNGGQINNGQSKHPRAEKGSARSTIPPIAELPTQIDNSLYIDWIDVPGSRKKKKIYPLAPVSSPQWSASEYRDRFAYVHGQIRRAIDRHGDLRNHASSINFQLNMVGTSPRTAEPSIVITCRTGQYKQLRSLLKEKAREKLYCGKRSKVYEMFRRHPPVKPPFNLVYYRTTNQTIKRKADWQTVSVDTISLDILCGAPIRHGGAKARIGITLHVGDKVLSTTVGHLFGLPPGLEQSEKDDDETLSIESVDSDQRTLDDADLVSLGPLWGDDSDDEALEDFDTPPTFDSLPNVSIPRPSFVSNDMNGTLTGDRHEGAIELPHSEPYLDWATVSIERSAMSRLQPNAFRVSGPSSNTSIIQSIADAPRAHAVPVYILSKDEGYRTGQLLSNYAYLGSNAGQEPCKVWTLILDGNEDLADGDCGSAVVDQETSAVYGHVIGSNPMNQVYVVPFKHIVEQIKFAFGTSDVRLLDPTKLPQPCSNAADNPHVASDDAIPTSFDSDTDHAPRASDNTPSRLTSLRTYYSVNVESDSRLSISPTFARRSASFIQPQNLPLSEWFRQECTGRMSSSSRAASSPNIVTKPEEIAEDMACRLIVPYRRRNSFPESAGAGYETIGYRSRRSADGFNCRCGHVHDVLSAESLPDALHVVRDLFRSTSRPTSKSQILSFWLKVLQIISPRKGTPHTGRYSHFTTKIPCSKKWNYAPKDSIMTSVPQISLIPVRLDLSWTREQQSSFRSERHPTSDEAQPRTQVIKSISLSGLCHYCRTRLELRRAYCLFSIGCLLLESLVWVLSGYDGLRDLENRRRKSEANVSTADTEVELFNRHSNLLQAKAISNGDAATLEVLQMTERILNEEQLEFPELWRWQQKTSEEFERRLAIIRRKEAKIYGKATFNRRALENLVLENFARNPVIDPEGSRTRRYFGFGRLLRGVRHTFIRSISSELHLESKKLERQIIPHYENDTIPRSRERH